MNFSAPVHASGEPALSNILEVSGKPLPIHHEVRDIDIFRRH
jgi:hypothetical protein